MPASGKASLRAHVSVRVFVGLGVDSPGATCFLALPYVQPELASSVRDKFGTVPALSIPGGVNSDSCANQPNENDLFDNVS
jgi:hypothetical protein